MALEALTGTETSLEVERILRLARPRLLRACQGNTESLFDQKAR